MVVNNEQLGKVSDSSLEPGTHAQVCSLARHFTSCCTTFLFQYFHPDTPEIEEGQFKVQIRAYV